jgi:hypothetical protein
MMPTSSSARLASLAVLFVLCFALTGCGKSKVTKENFDKITNDMTLAEVEAILGAGDKQGDGAVVAAQFGVDTGVANTPSTTDYLWESGQKSITVTFKGGKVISKRPVGL